MDIVSFSGAATVALASTIAFVFVALMSIPLSYSISLGIKNGLKGVDYPRGREIWTKIGDAIIDTAGSRSLNNQTRQAEITDAMRHILRQLKPYLDVFDEMREEPAPLRDSVE